MTVKKVRVPTKVLEQLKKKENNRAKEPQRKEKREAKNKGNEQLTVKYININNLPASLSPSPCPSTSLPHSIPHIKYKK